MFIFDCLSSSYECVSQQMRKKIRRSLLATHAHTLSGVKKADEEIQRYNSKI